MAHFITKRCQGKYVGLLVVRHITDNPKTRIHKGMPNTKASNTASFYINACHDSHIKAFPYRPCSLMRYKYTLWSQEEKNRGEPTRAHAKEEATRKVSNREEGLFYTEKCIFLSVHIYRGFSDTAAQSIYVNGHR